MPVASDTQGFPEEAVSGCVPTPWVQALEMERKPLKSPETLTLGQVPHKSFILFH